MNWAMYGLAALAVGLPAAAKADPANADLWIGFQNSEDGFLLDQDSGELWMTGTCMKRLEKATQTGTVWTSHTVELVSVGRSSALLDQTFRLDVSDASPQVSVRSEGRGGEQSFAAQINRDCETGGTCAQLIATQVYCAD